MEIKEFLNMANRFQIHGLWLEENKDKFKKLTEETTTQKIRGIENENSIAESKDLKKLDIVNDDAKGNISENMQEEAKHEEILKNIDIKSELIMNKFENIKLKKDKHKTKTLKQAVLKPNL